VVLERRLHPSKTRSGSIEEEEEKWKEDDSEQSASNDDVSRHDARLRNGAGTRGVEGRSGGRPGCGRDASLWDCARSNMELGTAPASISNAESTTTTWSVGTDTFTSSTRLVLNGSSKERNDALRQASKAPSRN